MHYYLKRLMNKIRSSKQIEDSKVDLNYPSYKDTVDINRKGYRILNISKTKTITLPLPKYHEKFYEIDQIIQMLYSYYSSGETKRKGKVYLRIGIALKN